MTELVSSSEDVAGAPAVYRVLARKYRPRTFDELIGQDALVRTLTNAITSGRIAQAFMLTGVRGVGKTTTARIIARALNCTGPDGRGGPTVTPCGVCDNCRAIAEDRHVDVMEMDAASHTGVDDIREIIDGVRYAPVAARYKLYIIDEVHMLSRSAFNALLKTLEEPPAHVKFVFATTEIRKVPVTVLSRCQRFDLRRVDAAVLKEHFTRITETEGAAIEPDAAALIARAADGSVRDGLSLLDQAIALSGGGAVSAQQVRDMLGLADRSRVIDLFDAAVTAKPADALAILADLHRVGADPVVIVQDLLDLTHNLTRLKVVPGTAADPSLPEAERTRGASLSGALSMPALTRAWQMLLKGLGEVQAAPVPQQALEMVIIRLSYAADLPTPGDLIRQLQNGGGGAGGGGRAMAAPPASVPSVSGPSAMAAPASAQAMAPRGGGPVAVAGAAAPRAQATASAPAPQDDADLSPMPRDFRALVTLFAERREGALYGHLYSAVHLVRMEPGRLVIRPTHAAPPNVANRVGALLSEWTGHRWVVVVSDERGQPTLAEEVNQAQAQALAAAEANPVVRAVLDLFPGAKIAEVRDLAAQVAEEAAGGGEESAGFLPAPVDGDGVGDDVSDDVGFYPLD